MGSQVLSIFSGQYVFFFSLLGALVGIRPVTAIRPGAVRSTTGQHGVLSRRLAVALGRRDGYERRQRLQRLPQLLPLARELHRVLCGGLRLRLQVPAARRAVVMLLLDVVLRRHLLLLVPLLYPPFRDDLLSRGEVVHEGAPPLALDLSEVAGMYHQQGLVPHPHRRFRLIWQLVFDTAVHM